MTHSDSMRVSYQFVSCVRHIELVRTFQCLLAMCLDRCFAPHQHWLPHPNTRLLRKSTSSFVYDRLAGMEVKDRGINSVTYNQSFEENKAALHLERIFRFGMRRGIRRYMYALHGYGDSFLSTIPGIVFSFSYAVSQVVAVRWGLKLHSSKTPMRAGVARLYLYCYFVFAL